MDLFPFASSLKRTFIGSFVFGIFVFLILIMKKSTYLFSTAKIGKKTIQKGKKRTKTDFSFKLFYVTVYQYDKI